MSIFSEENIISILYSYNSWWRSGTVLKDFDKPIKRIPYYEANNSFNNSLRRMVLLSGARRTGKTTIMYQTISSLLKKGVNPKNIVFISFDHPLLKMCSINEVLSVYVQNISSDNDIYCFFDEIQYSTDWNQWLKVLYDTNPYIKVMATGSASPILQKEVRESGLGRWITIPVPTLSFYEYCELLNIYKVDLPKNIKPTQLYLLSNKEQVDLFKKLDYLQPHFIRYLQVGGFPELALSSDDIYAQRVLREDIVDKALKRDLPSIFSIRNVNDLEKVFLYLCYNSSNIINYTTICKEMGINRETLDKYISYLESANLIYISKQVDISSKQTLKSRNKIYISDAAIRNAVLMKDDITNDPTELGIIAETAIYRHVKAFNYNTLADVGYFRGGDDNKEIDIVIKYHASQPPIMIEVKYREDSHITEKDLIVKMANGIYPNLVITKKIDDYGLYNQFSKGKSIYKIPAPIFVYLLGYVENYKNKNV